MAEDERVAQRGIGVRGSSGGIAALEEVGLSRAARRAIDRLAPAQRLLIVLRDLEGLSYDQMARATGLSVEMVSSRLKRARESLARELTGRFAGRSDRAAPLKPT